MRVRRPLIAVADKTGLVPFARGLDELEVEIISTGGTARELHASQVPVTEVSAVTGVPELMDGRVKTLHRNVHAAILGRRGKPYNEDYLETHGVAMSPGRRAGREFRAPAKGLRLGEVCS